MELMKPDALDRINEHATYTAGQAGKVIGCHGNRILYAIAHGQIEAEKRPNNMPGKDELRRRLDNAAKVYDVLKSIA